MSLQAYPAAQPSITLIGMDADSLDVIEKVAREVGQVTSRVLLHQMVPPEERLSPILILDASDVVDGPSADAVERIAAETPSTTQMVVRTSLNNVDLVDSLCPRARLVVGQDLGEIRLALVSSAAALEVLNGSLVDVTTDEGMRLQRLADEIARIARTLVDLPEGLNRSVTAGRSSIAARDSEGAQNAVVVEQTPVSATEVRAIIRLRRMRDRYFPAELFADPAWDMLLDLAAARIERVRVAVSSLCIAAAVPPTTALRWIKAMTEQGLLRRVADPHDARRIFIQLSDDAAAAMEQYLRAARASGGMAI